MRMKNTRWENFRVSWLIAIMSIPLPVGCVGNSRKFGIDDVPKIGLTSHEVGRLWKSSSTHEKHKYLTDLLNQDWEVDGPDLDPSLTLLSGMTKSSVVLFLGAPSTDAGNRIFYDIGEIQRMSCFDKITQDLIPGIRRGSDFLIIGFDSQSHIVFLVSVGT